LEVVVEPRLTPRRERVGGLEQPARQPVTEVALDLGDVRASGEIGGLAGVCDAVVELGALVEPFDVAPVRGAHCCGAPDEFRVFVLELLFGAVGAGVARFEQGFF
jgi:hypothetical protein